MLAELIGNSHAVVALREEVGRLLQRPPRGRSLPPILIEGETGTGKGLLAGAIHRDGPRRAGAFVAVNCAAIPETLIEAELFGFERGAFTDARHAKPGLVETAHGGTLFLDEIGLLPGALQGKFLTVLEEGVVRRLGRTRSDPVDIAVLAATSEDLRRAVREHRFSEALYHRLSVLTFRLPPLRERGEDILLLARHWLARSAADYGVPVKTLSPESRAALLGYSWPGNVRELRNLMERVTLLVRPGVVTPEMFGLAAPVELLPALPPRDAPRLRERLGSVERETLVDVMNQTGWNITRAAGRLGVPPTTLRYRLRKHGLLGGVSGAPGPSGAAERVPAPPSGGPGGAALDAGEVPASPPGAGDAGRVPARGPATPGQAPSPGPPGVVTARGSGGRLEAVTAGFTPLVGREQEVGLLLDRWEQAAEGRGQVVLVSGEAGIGKSRLVQAFNERLAGQPHARQAIYGSPHHEQAAFSPLIDHLQRRLGFEPEASPQEKLGRLEASLAEVRAVTGDEISLLAPLLSLPLPAGRRAPADAPQRVKERLLEILLAWLLGDADRQVTLSVWEDLQWVDPSTLELLDLLVEEAASARLLLLLTCRPEFARTWPPRSNLTRLPLLRLSSAQAALMVESVAHGRALPAAVVQELVARTDGVPLFVEELTKTVLESGNVPGTAGDAPTRGRAAPAAIPSTLPDSLMARLDRLGPAKETVQLAATLGREFSYEVLRAVSPMDEASLRRELVRLVDAELLYRKGSLPQARYLFKHALIQDAAYQSLLPGLKREYHGRIARTLEGRLALETEPELLAHHYAEAGMEAEAIAGWHRAGQRAMERGAIQEAIGHVSKGLALLEAMADTPERPAQEMALLLTQGSALLTIKDYTAPDVESVYVRARQLRHRIGDGSQLFAVLFALWRFHISRTELVEAQELARECFGLARNRGDRAILVQAHFALGVGALNVGQFGSALGHLEQAIALHDPGQRIELAFLSGTDPAAACRIYAARALWFLGYPDRALATSQEALNLAHRSTPRTTLAYTIHLAAALHTYRREPREVRRFADMAMTLAGEHGFERWQVGGLMRRGWALAHQGAALEGIAQLREGLAIWGSQLGRSHLLGLLAEAHGIAGEADAGLQVLDEALAIAQEKSERQDEAELHRLRGELLLQRDPAAHGHGETEACFRTAIDVARRQGAKMLELRAATSLSRLWQRGDRRAEARQMLAAIHAWFTEGFDTQDLREARTQLDALA